MEGRFDRIVSVGMFEHVGVHHYGEFFTKLNELMADDGVALIHSIGHMSPPGTASPRNTATPAQATFQAASLTPFIAVFRFI